MNKYLEGRIILFQEERIRVVDKAGRSFLLDLSHRLSLSNRELAAWIREGTPLVVSYEGDPETVSAIVHSIKKAA